MTRRGRLLPAATAVLIAGACGSGGEPQRAAAPAVSRDPAALFGTTWIGDCHWRRTTWELHTAEFRSNDTMRWNDFPLRWSEAGEGRIRLDSERGFLVLSFAVEGDSVVFTHEGQPCRLWRS